MLVGIKKEILILRILKLLSRIDSLNSATAAEKAIISYNLINKIKNLINSRITMKINSIDLIISSNLSLLVRIIVRILT